MSPDSTGPTAAPDGIRRYLLDITAVVAEGQLHVNWIHCPEIHSSATVERLAAAFLNRIRDLCAAQAGTRSTSPRDFPLAQLDQDQLAAVAAMLGDEED
jgi:non-ribosomal peptide synthase protein (TIGR01720 family)